MSQRSPFRYFKTSPEIIRLAVMMYIRFPLSLRNVEDLLHEHGIEISHETVRFWCNRFGPMLAAEVRKRRVDRMRCCRQWRWYLGEMFVKINLNGSFRSMQRIGTRRGRFDRYCLTDFRFGTLMTNSIRKRNSPCRSAMPSTISTGRSSAT